MEEEKKKLNWAWMLLAFLCPLVGGCLWAFWRDKYEDSKMLLIWALVGAVVFTFLRTIGM